MHIGKLKDYCQHHHYFVLSLILLLAISVRVAALLNYQNSIYADFLVWDEQVYQNWAIKILRGDYSTLTNLDHAPLPAYVMALLYKIFSNSLLTFRIFNIFLSSITCYLMYEIGKSLANRSVGLLSCFISALYGPFIFFSFTLLKTSLALFLFALTLTLFLRSFKTVSKFKIVGIGIAIGCIINVRPNMILVLFFLPFVLMWVWYKQKLPWRKIVILFACYIAGLIISVGPFSVMKYRGSGEISLTAPGGFNLYLANNLQNPYPYYRPVSFAVSTPSEQGNHFIVEASRRSGKQLSPHEASSFFIREVVKSCYEHPFLFGQKVIIKFLAFLNKFESADNYHIEFICDYIRLFKLPFIPFWLVMPLGMLGFAATLKSSKMSRALACIFFLYGITLIIFFSNIRIRVPLVVILIPMSAWGIVILQSLVKDCRVKRALGLGMVGIGFALIAFIPIPGSDDMTGHYNTHAINLSRKGKTQEAVAFWEKSSQMKKPYSAYANLSLANVYLKKGKVERALEYLNMIPSDSFASAQRYEMMGDIYRRQRNELDAVAAYEKSLDINSASMIVRRKLIDLKRKMEFQELQKLKGNADFINRFPGNGI